MSERYKAVEVKINPTGLGGSSGYLFTQLVDNGKAIGKFDSYHECFRVAEKLNKLEDLANEN